MKTLLSLIAVSGALFAVSLTHAAELVDVSVVDRDTGALIKSHLHDGKLYLVGIPGHRYAVRLANLTAARVMTVLSVDGVNAITGETASPEQNGYVLDPYQGTEVTGWRKSMHEVAQFNFTALDNSYAARTGRARNVGVIGVAIFREKQPVWRDERIGAKPRAQGYGSNALDKAMPLPSPAPPPPSAAAAQRASADAPRESESALAGADSAPRSMARKAESLGTGHGAREVSDITYTTFERARPQPDEVATLWYDSFNNLVARGVIVIPHPVAHEPQAFPQQFVADPA